MEGGLWAYFKNAPIEAFFRDTVFGAIFDTINCPPPPHICVVGLGKMPRTHAPTHATTHAMTHAWPHLPINPNPNLTPPNRGAFELHDTAARH